MLYDNEKEKNTMLKVGDKVKTLPISTNTDSANRVYANREAIIKDICFPYGLHKQYIIEFVEPFMDHGYLVTGHYYYDFQNGLELIT